MSKVLSAEQTASLGSIVKDAEASGKSIPAGNNFKVRAKEAVKTFTNETLKWGGVALMVCGIGMAAWASPDYARYPTQKEKDFLLKGTILAGAGLASAIAGGVRTMTQEEEKKKTIGFEEARRAMKNEGR